jgi:lysyl-tRNA synthetase class 1
MGVQVEGAGKDHSTKGGARDVSNHIAREIFGYEPPFDIPYEFFLVGGKKMSSSKGRGSSAKEISDLFPPTLLRYALIGKDINQQIDVDPSGDSIPRLYDGYDDCADTARRGVVDMFSRIYELSQTPENQAGVGTPWQLRFSQVAFIVQMPHLDLVKEAEQVKGSPLTQDEIALLTERAAYAQFWLGTYAPEKYKYELQNSIPEGLALSESQKKALSALLDFVKEGAHSGEEFHTRLHELKTEVPIEPKELFTALYQVLLGRDSGPKAGWFLSVLPQDFLNMRLGEAIQ